MTEATAHWTKPATRTAIIDKLVDGVDRYNPQNVEILEDYLHHQIRHREYDCLANLAVLKLYQFNPDLYNGEVVVNILLKALTATPAPDFNLCLALLGERTSANQTEEPDPIPILLPQLQYLYTILRTCRFPFFWEVYNSDDLTVLRKSYAIDCVGFEDAIRDVIIRIVTSTFTKISRPRLESYLNLKGGAFDVYISKLGWTVDVKGVITIPPNPDNQIQATVIREDIQFNQLSKIIAHAQSL